MTEEKQGTSFFYIYCRFLERISDDMYMELSLSETLRIIETILLDSLSEFTYPRFRIYKYDDKAITLDGVDENGQPIVQGAFADTLTNEEVDILTEIMLLNWYRRQLASTRITQMRYSTSDFKQTSQAAHMQRLDSVIGSQHKIIKRKLNNYSKRITSDDGYISSGYKDGLSGVGHAVFVKNILTQFGQVKL